MATAALANLASPYPLIVSAPTPMADLIVIPIKPLPGVASGTDTQVGYAQ